MNSNEFKLNSFNILMDAVKNITEELLTFTTKVSNNFFEDLKNQYKIKTSKEGNDIVCQEQEEEEDLQRIQD